ncbi:MAG: LysR substrate-binding domain-containing protein [Pseudomonadota bacterium]
MNALRAFVSIYLTGGIRPAGRALGVSHSAVARQLQQLEALLGAPLVERGKAERAISFTPLGDRLGREGAKAFGQLEQSWSAARERRPAQAVTISAAPSFAALWLLPRLPLLAEAHPRIELSVLAEQRIRDPAEEGSDLTIRMGRPRAGERALPFMDDALVPVANPGLLARARAARGGPTGDTRTETLLRDLPLLHDRDPNAGWALWIDHFGPRDIDQAAGPRFSSSDLVLRASKQGQGVALARLRLAADDIATGALERLTTAALPLPRAYWVIENRERTERASLRLVRDWLLAMGRAPIMP